MKVVSLRGRPGDGVRGRYGGLGGVSGRGGFRVSVRARERDRQLGGLPSGPESRLKGSGGLGARSATRVPARVWHRIIHKRGSGRLLLLVVSGSCWAGASSGGSRALPCWGGGRVSL